MVATLPRSAPVEIRSSVAGYAQSCYAVTAVVDGKSVRGYVQGNSLEAIAEFERQRAVRDAALVNPPAAAVADPSLPATAAPASPVEKPHYPPFPGFSALDMKRRSVSTRNLKGKVNLVCFWSPNSKDASRELLLVNRLYSQYKKQGMDAMAVNFSGESPQLQDTLDDYHLGFPNVPNGYDVAMKFNLQYETLPRTYVLNENLEVIASGLHTNALEDLVKKLMAEK
jgi:hypothetical protein